MTENTNFKTDLKKYRDKLTISENGLTNNITWLYAISLLCICIIIGIAHYTGYQEILDSTSLKSSLFEWLIFLLVGLGFGHGFEYLKYKIQAQYYLSLVFQLLVFFYHQDTKFSCLQIK